MYGHIVDPNNIPIPNVFVEAIKVIYGPRGDQSVVTAESAFTDDRGEYHLYWLDPGEYYIRASSLVQKPNAGPPGDPIVDGSGPTYAPTYFPGFRDPKDAASIRLRVGSNLSAFDFKLQPASAVNLSGHIYIEATGESVGTIITAVPAGEWANTHEYQASSGSPDSQSRNLGDFSILGMLPNTYVVSAQFRTKNGQQLTVHRKFLLKGNERAFILKMSPGSPVTGRVTAESGDGVELRSSHIVLESVDPDLPSPQRASLEPNGQFAAARVEPGDYDIRIQDLPSSVYMKSARSGDADILANPLHLDFASPEPVRIILGIDGGRLGGVVVDSSHRSFAGAQMVLVPDAARRSAPSQYRTAISGEDGRFLLDAIPPGEYKIFAWQSIEPNAYLNPNYMQGDEALGIPVTIPPSSTGTISVALIPSD
jgi:hypothetical protein